MSTQTRCSIFLPLLLSAFFTFPVAAGDVLSVRDKGVDGEVGIYQVICASGYRTTVTVFFREKPFRRCTYPYNGYGKSVCRTTWTVDEAAAWACREYR